MSGRTAGDIAAVVFITSGVLLIFCTTYVLALWARRRTGAGLTRFLLADAGLLVVCVGAFVWGAT